MARAFDYFVIIAAMRTGSNLLEASINQYPGLHCHGELYNPGFIGHEGQHALFGIDMGLRGRHPERLIEAIRAADPDVLPGFRLFDGHDQRIVGRAIADPRAAKIVLRRSPLDSYLSETTARQTGQWKLADGRKRKAVAAHFDADGFEAYCADLDAWYSGLERQIRQAGQTFFPIRYEECRDVAVLNGLALWLNESEGLKSLKQLTRRQNVLPLTERIANFADFEAYLGRSGYVAETETAPPDHWPFLRATEVLAGERAVFARLPGSDHDGLAALLPGAIPRLGAAGLGQWQRKNPGRPVFTYLCRPLTRAFAVYQRQVLLGEAQHSTELRQHLARSHGAAMPMIGPEDRRAGLEAAGFGAAEARAGLAAFLDFAAASAAGRTPLRPDPAWLPQRPALDALATRVPVSAVLREDRLEPGLAYLAALSGLPASLPAATSALPFALDEVETPALTARAAEVYAADVNAFGF